MKSKIIACLAAGILALTSCEVNKGKTEKPAVKERTSVQKTESKLEDLLKADPNQRKNKTEDNLSPKFDEYEDNIDKRISSLRKQKIVIQEERRLTTYLQLYNSVMNVENNVSDLQVALNRTNKIIADFEKEKFNYEEDLVNKLSSSHNFRGLNRFLQDLKNHQNGLRNKIEAIKTEERISNEEERIRDYLKRYSSVVSDKSPNPKIVLDKTNKLISDFEKERFQHESELVRRVNGFQGIRKFRADLSSYKSEIERTFTKRLIASLDKVRSHVVIPSSTYNINFDIIIHPSGVLEIQPGTRFNFGSNGGIIAYGTLRAIGTKKDKIYFTASDSRFRNICFVGNSSNNSILKYCSITRGSGRKEIPSSSNFKGIKFLSELGGGMMIYYSSPSIINCTIENNSSYYVGGGIFMDHSNSVIQSNIIRFNNTSYGGGIRMDDSNPVLKNNIITNNHAKSGGGGVYILYKSGSRPSVEEGNKILNNEGFLQPNVKYHPY